MNDTLEPCVRWTVRIRSHGIIISIKSKWYISLITEKSRLATAAAAMVHNMMILRRLLVFLPVLPWRKGSIGVVTAMTDIGR